MKRFENNDIEDKDNKHMNYIYYLVTGITLSTTGAILLMSIGMSGLIAALLVYPIGVPSAWYFLDKLNKKINDDFNRDMARANQLIASFQELNDNDHKITSKTVMYYQEIINKLSNNNVLLDHDSMTTINQFLYMININYYSLIKESIPRLRRDELINRILDQITLYLIKNNQQTFNDFDASEVIKKCFFIKEDIQNQIIKEFSSSKYLMGNSIDYRILKNNEILVETEPLVDHNRCQFDITSIDEYKLIVTILNQKVPTQYGDFSHLEWDYEILKEVMISIINNHSKELYELDNEFYHFDLVASFIYNAAIYAKLNKKSSVGINEIINTFKEWPYIPFSLKLSMLDTIFKELNLDYKSHPFRKTEHIEKKVLEFVPKTEKSNKF